MARAFAKAASPLFELCLPNAPCVPLVQFLIGDQFAEKPLPDQELASPGPIQMYCCDGAGLSSTGDWSFPPPGAKDTFGKLRKAFLKKAVELKIPQRLVAHTVSESNEPLLNDQEVFGLQSLAAAFLFVLWSVCLP